MYIQLIWEDPETGESKQQLLTAPVAIGRDLAQLPEQLGGQSVSRLELESGEISRYHALITVSNQQVYVNDQSTNGTFLNGQPIRKGNQPISSKDTLRIGPYKMTVTLFQEGDLNATAQNPDRTSLSGGSSSAPDNKMVIGLIGAVVLVLMGTGAWLLVSTLLKNSRPTAPAPSSSIPLPSSIAALPTVNIHQ